MKQLTEKEWVESFEEIHNRKPSPDEFMEGMKKGEFQILESQQISSGKMQSKAFEKFRNLSALFISNRLILYIILVFLGLIILFVFLGSNRTPFNQTNFENGAWVVIGLEESHDVETVHFMSGAWEDIVYDWGDEAKFEYLTFSKFIDLQKLENQTPVTSLSSEQVVNRMEIATGLKGIDTSKLMVISKGDEHMIFYWLNSDRAIFYMPTEGNIYVTQKLNTDITLKGEYSFIDYYSANLDDFSDKVSNFTDPDNTIDFDEFILRNDSNNPTFNTLSYDKFLEVYQLAGGDVSDIKDLSEVNKGLRRVGNELQDFDSVSIAFLGDGTYGIKSGDVYMFDITAFALFVIPVEYETKVLLTPTASSKWFGTIVSESGFDYDKKQDLLKEARMVIVSEKEEW